MMARAMKYANEFGLIPGALDEYRRRHDEIWPEMVNMINAAGLENYSIWSVGTRLIEYFECADMDFARRVIESSPVKKRWDEYMSDILEGEIIPLTHVFELSDHEI